MTPTQNAQLAEQDLSSTKRALMEAKLRGLNRPRRIVRASREGAPVSFAQERLWFLERLQHGGTVYNVPAVRPLHGPLDVAALERAVGEVVRRHEALRTTFRETDGVPVQVVAPFDGFELPVEDLAAMDPAEREAEVRRRIAADAAEPFDLVAGPPFRARLLRLGPQEHVLLLCMHHIVSDGLSLEILFRELAALGAAYHAGRESPLPELPVQYADYASWQREQWRGDLAARQLAYWTEQLSGAPEVLELPTDRARPAAPSFRGGSVPVRIPGVLEPLRELARNEGATLYMVALAAFQVLLSRYSGSDDVVVGTPVAGRTHREVEELIGLFVNVLVLRTDLSGDPGFRALVGRVREVVLGAFEHQEVPFERLVAELRPERTLSHSPLFQVTFSLEDADQPDTGDGALPPQDGGGTQIGLTKFDLTLSLAPRGGGLAGTLEYSSDLFERDTVERMAGHLARVLEQVAADPGRRLSTLELVAEAERSRVVGEWNPAVEFPVSGALHQRFEAQAARSPGAVAVTCGGDALDYGTLNARANRLARRLRGLGVGPESRVGLCSERSLDLVVGILAILKAGGAYVPLDPAYPPDRLAYMAEDSGVRVLLGQADLQGRVPGEGVRFVALEDVPADEDAGDLGLPVHAEQLAYVIYTSGSTGRPKGVGVTHGNVLRLFESTQASFGFGAGDVWALFHSYAFDFSVWEIWGALLHGGRLVVVPWMISRYPAAFHELVGREGVTVLNQTPSAFRALAQADQEADSRLDRLRVVVFGGEALQYESLRGWLDRYGPERPRLVNMYGITETTVHVTWHTVTAADLQQEQAGSNVGVPIPDLRAYVLDPAGTPSPVGVPGELYVGGAGLARGYLGRAALTAERFVPDPFSGREGMRLYRSGDRVRWRADGTLDYLGRIDQQVKVRGFRIELGEIEGVLLAQPGVRAAAVVVRGEGEEAMLVAYVAMEEEAPSPSRLRAALLQHLPEYMVPAAVVPIERIPLTANGKLDRKALPAPQFGLADLEESEPKNYVEVQLIQIWEQQLGIQGIGPTQSFFELGGNSLLALRVFAQINRRLECDLPVATLFTGATVREMANAIYEQLSSTAPPPGALVTLQSQGSLPPVFFVHSAGRDVMGYVNLVRHLGVDQPAYGLRDLGDTSRPLSQIAAEHVESIRAVQPQGPYYLAGWCFGGHVASEMALQLEDAGETVAFLGLLDAMPPVIAAVWAPQTDAQLAVGLGGDVAARLQRRFRMSSEPLEGLELDEILRRVTAELHAQGAAPANFNEAVLGEMFRILTDRHVSLSGYVPRGPISSQVTLFRATENRDVWNAYFASKTPEEGDTMGWCGFASRPVEAFPVPGNHASIGSEPHVRVLARHVQESLARARERAGFRGTEDPAGLPEAGAAAPVML